MSVRFSNDSTGFSGSFSTPINIGTPVETGHFLFAAEQGATGGTDNPQTGSLFTKLGRFPSPYAFVAEYMLISGSTPVSATFTDDNTNSPHYAATLGFTIAPGGLDMVSIDIDGTTRYTIWDIGADQVTYASTFYVPATRPFIIRGMFS